jgi:hypothetical protein
VKFFNGTGATPSDEEGGAAWREKPLDRMNPVRGFGMK